MIFQWKENKMKKYDTIFLDRDGTLNPDPGYINSLDKYAFFDFTIPALNEMSKYCNGFCIITNQSGLSREIIQIDELSKIHNFILNEFYQNKLNLLGIYFCPDHPDKPTINRKPGIGMFQAAAKDHNINLKNSIMIGDALSDIEAGLNLNMDTMLVLTGRGKKSKENLKGFNPNFIADNLMDGAKTLYRHFR